MSSVVTEVDAPAFPQKYDPAQWLGENKVQAPYGYTRTRFSLEFLREKIFGRTDFPLVSILGWDVRASNTQFSVAPRDENYPIYFEVSGRTYHYIFSIWADRVEICVCRFIRHTPVSYMFPVTEDQLVQALETVIYDYHFGIR